jgi:hypothetical protein
MTKITKNPPQVIAPGDFNFNPFLENHSYANIVFPGDHASGFFKFSGVPAVGNTLVVNGVTFTFEAGTGADAHATGYYSFDTNPVDGDVMTVNGVVFTFKDSPSGAVQIQTDVSNRDTAGASAATVLNASVNGSVSTATYTYDSVTHRLNVSFDAVGGAGNAFTLAKTSTHLSVSGTHLTGGAGGTSALGIGNNLSDTLHNIEEKLNGSASGSVNVATYDADVLAPAFNDAVFNNLVHIVAPASAMLNIVYDTAGAAGEAFTLAFTGTVISRSAATLELGKVAHAKVIRMFME